MKLTNIKLKLKGGAIMPLKYIKSLNANEKEIDFDELTPEQQMEVRKNLGLYYEETSVGEKTAKYTDEEVIYGTNVYAKISDDTPSKEDIVSFAGDTGDNLYMYDYPGVVGYTVMAASLPMAAEILVVLEESGGYEAGIYYNKIGISNKETAILVYKGETTTVHKIDAKFLPEQESGGMPIINLLKVPIESGSIDITEYFSEEDLNILTNFGTNCAVNTNGVNKSMYTINGNYYEDPLMGAKELTLNFLYSTYGVYFIIHRQGDIGNYQWSVQMYNNG